MINYKLSYILINFGIYLMTKFIPSDKIFENSARVELLFLLTEHSISCFLEILSLR